MSREIKFTVMGEPQGKGRPRFSKVNGRAFARTPHETVLYENLIRTEYERQCGQVRFGDQDMVVVRVSAFFAIPQSISKKKRAAMLAREILPIKKPDFDNIGKVVCDSLNGLAYRDDSQVVRGVVQKFYDERPRIEVSIREWTGPKG